ncbi:TetR/AcrR family transcriptional regulator [Nocardia thailandica]|uniref:TetR/AcrR family transcriptional regulator n=1 Tax=Nocardia thailandica TaxID=257275 RepID=A0ABW6PXE3_9NOCA
MTKRRTVPSQDRARETRTHILDTAAALFGRDGVAQVSTNRIAADAEVSVGTLYRYFSDKAVIVDELTERLIAEVEDRFTERAFEFSSRWRAGSVEAYTAVLEEILGVFSEVLVPDAALLRALVGGVQFYSSGLPELEKRLRIMVKVILIQNLGPRENEYLDTATRVFINTGFAAVVRSAVEGVTDEDRDRVITMTAHMMGAWMAAETAPGVTGARH